MVTIPPNFDKPWAKSTVILKVPDGDEIKSVYVNKTLLAFHSPYFKRLFNGDWKEKNQAEIPLEVPYEPFLRALRLLHHLDQELVTVNEFVETFRIGDQLDIPEIRRRCNQIKNSKLNRVDKLLYQEAIEAIEKRKDVLQTMTRRELMQYMKVCSPDTTMNLEEILVIFEKLDSEVLRDDTAESDPTEAAKLCSYCSRKLQRDSNKRRCDSCREIAIKGGFESSWSLSDIALITWEKDDKLLWVNEEILSIFCELPTTKIVDGQKSKFIKGDYAHILEALRALHSVLDPSAMYRNIMGYLMKGLEALNANCLMERMMTFIDQQNSRTEQQNSDKTTTTKRPTTTSTPTTSKLSTSPLFASDRPSRQPTCWANMLGPPVPAPLRIPYLHGRELLQCTGGQPSSMDKSTASPSSGRTPRMAPPGSSPNERLLYEILVTFGERGRENSKNYTKNRCGFIGLPSEPGNRA